MIAMLTGKVALRATDHVVLDVGGVGYAVFCAEATLARLPGRGEVARMYTEMVVREDSMTLFGFLTPMEREWHRLLTSVQGVGAKVALSIQGTLGAGGVSRAIALGDWNAVKAAPGVGPKIAQRIVNELKDKAATVMAMGDVGEDDSEVIEGDAEAAPTTIKPATRAPRGNAAAQAEALSALLNLGYGQGEAAAAVATVAETDPDAATPALIRAALRALAPKG